MQFTVRALTATSHIESVQVEAADLAGANVAKPSADAARETRIDRELHDAGIVPGDPSLYPAATPTAPSGTVDPDGAG